MDHRYVQLTELEQCYDAVIWDVTDGSHTIVEAFRATTMRELLNELYSSAQLEDDDAVLWYDGSLCSFGEAMVVRLLVELVQNVIYRDVV